MKEKQFYVEPQITVVYFSTRNSLLTGSSEVQDSSVNFEDLEDGGDFAW